MARKRITLALAKGRIFNDTLTLLEKSGISIKKIDKKSRELIFKLDELTILSCKPSDVPKYVELGAADCGIVGSDCIAESQCDIYEPLSLNFGHCKMIVAIKKNQKFKYFDLNKAARSFDINLSKIPISIKIIIENLLRNEDGENVTKDMISKTFSSLNEINPRNEKIEIAFFPTRVLMQDFTGVPAVADLAAMRNALKAKGIEPKK